MKRYIIFAFDTYYPAGGQADIIAHEDNRDTAIQKAKELKSYHIREVYDCEIEEVIWSKG